MERIGKRKKWTRSGLSVSLCLAAVLLLVCLAAVWFSTASDPLEPLEGELPNGRSSGTENADEASRSGDFSYRISGEMYIRDGVGDILK